MRLTRRRFLWISAAAAMPSRARSETSRWIGRAFGSEASIELTGPGAEDALQSVLALIRKTEAIFSLYDPASVLVQLNTVGQLSPVPEALVPVLKSASLVQKATAGAFDPTVQTIWDGLRLGRRQGHLVGWSHVDISSGAIRLKSGQSLTFNGIVQGHVTDLVADELERRGFRRALVAVGEHRGIGGPWRLALEDPAYGALGTRTIRDGAIATSSPGAMVLSNGDMHILAPGPQWRSRWSTVSVEADQAMTADAFSTAACLMREAEIRDAMGHLPGIRRVTTVDFDGRLRTLS